jgi:hypothetical protein
MVGDQGYDIRLVVDDQDSFAARRRDHTLRTVR